MVVKPKLINKVLTTIAYIILISPLIVFVYELMLGVPPWVAAGYMLSEAGYAFIFLLPFRSHFTLGGRNCFNKPTIKNKNRNDSKLWRGNREAG